MLINTAIDDCSIINLRAVVLDELHMVDDDHRGYLMELIATKLMSLEQSVQIIGMSATLAVSDISAVVLPTPSLRTANICRTSKSCQPGLMPIHIRPFTGLYLWRSTWSTITRSTRLRA